MNRKPPVVVIENELLAGRGAVEPELAPRDDLGARPGAQPLCLRPSVEGLERDVDVLELLPGRRRSAVSASAVRSSPRANRDHAASQTRTLAPLAPRWWAPMQTARRSARQRRQTTRRAHQRSQQR